MPPNWNLCWFEVLGWWSRGMWWQFGVLRLFGERFCLCRGCLERLGQSAISDRQRAGEILGRSGIFLDDQIIACDLFTN